MGTQIQSVPHRIGLMTSGHFLGTLLTFYNTHLIPALTFPQQQGKLPNPPIGSF